MGSVSASIGVTIGSPPVKQWDERFSYDSLGRLDIAAEYRGDNTQLTWRTDYDYDRYGNRLQNGGQNYNLSYTQVQSSDLNSQTNRFTTSVTYNHQTARFTNPPDREIR
jgi:hypothetical protein